MQQPQGEMLVMMTCWQQGGKRHAGRCDLAGMAPVGSLTCKRVQSRITEGPYACKDVLRSSASKAFWRQHHLVGLGGDTVPMEGECAGAP